MVHHHTEDLSEALERIDMILYRKHHHSLSYETFYRFFYRYTINGGVFEPIGRHVERVLEGLLIPRIAILLLRGGTLEDLRLRWKMLCDVLLFPERTGRLILESWENVVQKAWIHGT